MSRATEMAVDCCRFWPEPVTRTYITLQQVARCRCLRNPVRKKTIKQSEVSTLKPVENTVHSLPKKGMQPFVPRWSCLLSSWCRPSSSPAVWPRKRAFFAAGWQARVTAVPSEAVATTMAVEAGVRMDLCGGVARTEEGAEDDMVSPPKGGAGRASTGVCAVV